MRPRGEAVGALPEEDLVDVELEDLVLGQVGLDLPGQEDFAQLPGDRLLPGEKEVAGDLHGDRPGALLGPRGEIGPGGPQDAQVIHAAVRVEALVFGGQDGLLHHVRDVADADDGPALLPEFPQEVALDRDDPERNFGAVVRQAVERRKRRIKECQHEGAQESANHPQAKQDRTRRQSRHRLSIWE